MHFFDNILSLPTATLGHWGYLVLFVATLCETVPLFGVFIPGQTLVVASGLLAKIGIFHPTMLIFVISFGAILGDTIGYLLGRKYGHKFISKYGKHFLLGKSNFEKVSGLINDNVGKTLILGRLNSLTRATVPLVAGATKVPIEKFFTFNVLGGFLWSMTFVTLGFLFGTSYEIISKYFGKFIFIAIVATIAIIFIYRFVDKRRHIFEKYHLRTLSLCIVSLWIFLEMAQAVANNDLVVKFDAWLNEEVMTLWNPILNRMVLFITNIGGTVNIVILSIALLITLIIAKKWYNAVFLMFSMGGGVIAEKIVKAVVERPRPLNAMIEVSDFSFPSGHATMSIIFFSLLIYSFKKDIKNKVWKRLFIIGNITIFTLIGLSRIYLNVHWFSDVIAGFSLGLFWLTLLILAFKITISLANSYKERLSNPK
jgi:undecaprenyl-diphosphatase